MAGSGFAPKPGSINSAKGRVAFDWTVLPVEGRKGRAPALPALRVWDDEDRAYWRALWRKPQAVVWEREGHVEFVARLLALRHDFVHGDGAAAALSGEMRQLEDRLGLNPKALMGLRWRIVADEVAAARRPKAGGSARDRLRTVS